MPPAAANKLSVSRCSDADRELIAERRGAFPLFEVTHPMALETAQYISQLDAANPSGPDRIAQGDDHIRMIKRTLQATFPNLNGPMTLTDEFLNSLVGGLIPVGTIQLWSGASADIPLGYAICNGQTVNRTDGTGTVTTPDMRGRVPVGADATNAVGAKFGQASKTVTSGTAGAHTHTGKTKAGDGAHTHPVTVDGHALTLAEIPALDSTTNLSSGSYGSGATIDGLIGTNSAVPHTHTATITSSGAHVHDLTVDGVAAHSHSVTVDVTQSSIALHYIMKV